MSAPAKAGGVAPQWLGKPPRKPLTPEKAFVADRRATLLAANPDLRLLTCAPCGTQCRESICFVHPTQNCYHCTYGRCTGISAAVLMRQQCCSGVCRSGAGATGPAG